MDGNTAKILSETKTYHKIIRFEDEFFRMHPLDNTLIVFFGDHGYHLGEHNWWNKVTIFEKGTNPLFSAGKKTHHFLKSLIRKLREQGLRLLKIKEFTVVNNCFQREHNAVIGVFLRRLFIIAGQAVGEKGIDADAMLEYIDIYPMLANLFQLENIPDYLEGKSFAKVIKDPTLPFRNEVRAIISKGEMLGRMVKNKNYRYVE